MAVPEGKFALYSRIVPPLTAGDYRLTAAQTLKANAAAGQLDDGDLPVAQLPTYLRVRSPRFALPPEQVLSTFPPANSEGAFGMRLAQIVIKRRTLPWERLVAPDKTNATPWLTLVLIAEGEAELQTNQPVGECVTAGTVLDGIADAEKGSYLQIRKSIVNKVFPTQKDVPLLAHAREVDINDTELMMGDDDGFLAVVVSNRLPLGGRDADGNEVPIKYLACLVNLEGQFDKLLFEAPPPVLGTKFAGVLETLSVDTAGWDHLAMGRPPTAPGSAPVAADASPTVQAVRATAGAAAVAATPAGGTGQWSAPRGASSADDIYAEMARPFNRATLSGERLPLDPTYRFPVLLHWSFTSVGDTTFRKLMEQLDAGLLGTVSAPAAGEAPGPAAREPGRPPLEVVETGHVGLVQRTRRGDEVRGWYRGPFVPHPTADPPDGRLPLAHASDQLRVVVPDGREDLSLAAAFEIGRLLALARPSMVAALLRWRQLHYQAARRKTIWAGAAAFLGGLQVEMARLGPDLGIQLGRGLARSIAARPGAFLGEPRPLVTPGAPIDAGGAVIERLASGLGLRQELFRGDVNAVLGNLRATPPPVVAPPAGGSVSGVRGKLLAGALDQHLVALVADTFPGSIAGVGVGGGAFGGLRAEGGIAVDGASAGGLRRPAARRANSSDAPDALDRLLADLEPEKEPR